MTRSDRLQVRVLKEGDRLRAISPAVGHWSEIPVDGSVVGPGSIVGSVRQLHRRFVLEMPESVVGRIELPDPRRARDLAYGEEMFRISPISAERDTRASDAGRPARSGDDARGIMALRSPTDGVFYSRPAPDVAPFVTIGQSIRRGHPVGLIEVMKTFNQIVYEGPGLPDEGIVAEICVEDGEEISAGQPLLVLR